MELNCEITKRVVDELQAHDIKCYIVGGYVRDQILGVKSKDIDIELHNTTIEVAFAIVSRITEAKVFGNFGVISLTDANTEFAMARTERKIGEKHTGFEIDFITNGDLKLAASRRDFTINSIMYDLQTKQIIDNFNGIEDLNNRILRHVGPAFTEDPLRILRGIKFMARYDLQIAPETKLLCKQTVKQLMNLSPTRIQNELEAIFSAQYYKHTKSLLSELFALLLNNEIIKSNYTCEDASAHRLYFFKQFESYELAIDMSYEQKKMKRDLKFCIRNYDSYVSFANLKSEEKYDLLIDSKNRFEYIAIINPEVYEYYQLFLKLSAKYNGQYFLERGFTGKQIKMAMRSQIGAKLDEL